MVDCRGVGAIVSPPDEVAAAAVMERLAVPRRLLTLLQGESLLNDATALTLYRVALGTAIAATPALSLAPVGSFVVVAAGGIAIGWVVAWLIARVRTSLSDLPVELTVSPLDPVRRISPGGAVGRLRRARGRHGGFLPGSPIVAHHGLRCAARGPFRLGDALVPLERDCLSPHRP